MPLVANPRREVWNQVVPQCAIMPGDAPFMLVRPQMYSGIAVLRYFLASGQYRGFC